MACVNSSEYVVIGDPSLGQCPMGLSKILDLRRIEKIAGGGVEADDQTVL